MTVLVPSETLVHFVLDQVSFSSLCWVALGLDWRLLIAIEVEAINHKMALGSRLSEMQSWPNWKLKQHFPTQMIKYLFLKNCPLPPEIVRICQRTPRKLCLR